VSFTRGVVHTFTAPLGDLTLLSYHAPFFDLDDTRQYTIPVSVCEGPYVWTPAHIAPLPCSTMGRAFGHGAAPFPPSLARQRA
jgi:hypothetical protein